MSAINVWWACDIKRQLGFESGQTRTNVILDTGSFMKKGFTVENEIEFLKILRPLTNASFENWLPATFSDRPLPLPVILKSNGPEADMRPVMLTNSNISNQTNLELPHYSDIIYADNNQSK